MTRIVLACPGCNIADVQAHVSSIQERGAADHNYSCNTCGEKFDTPIRREARSTGSLSGLAARLDKADPDDVAGQSPAGSQTESDDVGRPGGAA